MEYWDLFDTLDSISNLPLEHLYKAKLAEYLGKPFQVYKVGAR